MVINKTTDFCSIIIIVCTRVQLKYDTGIKRNCTKEETVPVIKVRIIIPKLYFKYTQ